MKRLKTFVPFLILLGVTLLFFYKSVLFRQIPFPGDLQIADYAPWKTYSYLGYNPGSFPNKAQYFDVLRQFYPWRKLTTDLIKDKTIPLWNPYNFSGSPLLANGQSAVLYPFTLIYLFLSQPLAWTIMIILQHFLAGLFTYMYCKKIGLSLHASIFAAISFSFSLFMSVFSQYGIVGHTVLWLPFLLWSIENLKDHKKPIYILTLAIGTVMSAFAGHLQLFGMVFGITCFYALIRCTKTFSTRTSRMFLFTVFASMGVGILIAAIQLVPTLELVKLAARANHDFSFFVHILLLQPIQLILQIIPDAFGNPATNNYLINDTYPTNAIYIGLIPCIFAIFSVIRKKKTQIENTSLIMIGIFLLVFIRTPVSEFLYRYPLSSFLSSSPSNGIFIYSFFASILAGFGLDRWQKEKTQPFVILIGLSVIVALAFVAKLFHAPLIINSIIISGVLLVVTWTICLVTTINIRWKQIAATLLIFFTVADLGYYFLKFNPFVSASIVFPEAPIISWLQNQHSINRFWGYGSANVQPNFSSYYHVFSPDGYDPLYPKTYGAFIGSARSGTILTQFTDRNRSDAVITPGSGTHDFAQNIYRQKILNLLGVSYIFDRSDTGSTEETFPPNIFSKLYDRDGWRVYNNADALPRFFLATKFQIVTTNKDFEQIFFSPMFNPKSTILLTKKPTLSIPSDGKLGSVKLISYQSNQITFQTNTESNQLLFLSDTYYPGWKAYIDDSEIEIVQAFYAFRAIAVPSGNHIVTFRFQPQSVAIGVKMSIIGFIVLVVLLIILRKRHEN